VLEEAGNTKKIPMKKAPVFFACLLALPLPAWTQSHAAPASPAGETPMLQDVLYLRNGSVLRGDLEDDGSADGRLRIRTDDGLRIVPSRDVERRTREAPPAQDGATPVRIELTVGESLPLPTPSTTAQAPAASPPPPPRRPARSEADNTLTLGSYGLSISGPLQDDRYPGGAVGYQRALGDHLAVRLTGYALRYEYNDQETFDGYDVQLLLTTNARRSGFKLYLGGAYFSETYAAPSLGVKERFSGGGLVLGLGYNWRRMSLDWYGVGRFAEAYRLSPQEYAVGAGSLALGLRF